MFDYCFKFSFHLMYMFCLHKYICTMCILVLLEEHRRQLQMRQPGNAASDGYCLPCRSSELNLDTSLDGSWSTCS